MPYFQTMLTSAFTEVNRYFTISMLADTSINQTPPIGSRAYQRTAEFQREGVSATLPEPYAL